MPVPARGGRHASIGPRRWSRGRPNYHCVQIRRSSSFNGATTLESWKTTVKPRAYELGVRASMGPRRWSRRRRSGAGQIGQVYGTLQWGHDVGVVEDYVTEDDNCPEILASMAPRRWSRGRRARHGRVSNQCKSFNGATTLESWKTCIAESGRRRKHCFNGATTLESWKTRKSPNRSGSRPPLQWGHDVGVVEDLHADGGGDVGRDHASMGPRRWSRGRCRNAASDEAS